MTGKPGDIYPLDTSGCTMVLQASDWLSIVSHGIKLDMMVILVHSICRFPKSFDNFNRKSLWKLMRYYGIFEKLIRILKDVYEGMTCFKLE